MMVVGKELWMTKAEYDNLMAGGKQLLADELRKKSDETVRFTTDLLYEQLTLLLKGKALNGGKHYTETIDMADETKDWNSVFERMRKEGIRCEVDYYHGDEKHRKVTFSWNE